jgi:hypothetical protein
MMDNRQIGLNNLHDIIRTLRTLNIKKLVEVVISIYLDVSLHIHVLKDSCAQPVIFTRLILIIIIYLYILCTD